MADLDDFKVGNRVETIEELCSSETAEATNDNACEEMILDNTRDSLKTTLEAVDMQNEPPTALVKESTFENDSGVNVKSHETPNDSINCQEVDDKLNNIKIIEAENVSDVSDKLMQLDNLPKSGGFENATLGSRDADHSSSSLVKKIINIPDDFSDSSQSSSSELQSSAAPFESSSSSQENHINANRIDFENSVDSEKIWKEKSDSLSVSTNEMKRDVEPVLPSGAQSENISPACEIPLIAVDENTQPSASVKEAASSNNVEIPFLTPGFVPPSLLGQLQINDAQSEIKIEIAEQQPPLPPPPVPVPVPVIPPAPRKRGRPRKQVLPNPSPLMESWGSNAQEFPAVEAKKQERKRSARGERRQTKKKKFEDGEGQDGDENLTRKRKTSQATTKKKRRTTYVPKKKLPSSKKKHSEIENIQNFEEETRMSASEGPAGFSSRSGATGDESQSNSAAADGPSKSNINKKGRMEVGIDGCKPVTVQQIVEYFWPPPSSLPHGEKPEGLMIQEQITEYLGVKSFKRKYPSIKRRTVDMEERNYLQENGYVSENMCDMGEDVFGLTAVFAADIIEIMYNDFPHKFEEYRKYTRERKAKEQRALREKQAAERADMDPKKEAVESTTSWNTEFNKIRRLVK